MGWRHGLLFENTGEGDFAKYGTFNYSVCPISLHIQRGFSEEAAV